MDKNNVLVALYICLDAKYAAAQLIVHNVILPLQINFLNKILQDV